MMLKINTVIKMAALYVIYISLMGNGCTRADLYHPQATDVSVQLLGDSYMDYGDGKSNTAYIPPYVFYAVSQLRNENVIYGERTVSGALIGDLDDATDDDVYDQYVSAITENPGQVKTIIMNGGANDLRNPCKTNTLPAGNPLDDIHAVFDNTDAMIDADIIDSTCANAINSTLLTIEELLVRTNTDEIESVIWLSRYYMAADVTKPQVINYVNNKVKALCENHASINNCYFLETRKVSDDSTVGAWTAEEAAEFTLNEDGKEVYAYLRTGDGKHVNQVGGEIIGQLIVDLLTDPELGIHY